MISLPTVVFLTQRCNFANIDHVFAQSLKKFGNFLPSSRYLSPNCSFIVNKCSFDIFAQNFLLKVRQNLSYFGSLRSFSPKSSSRHGCSFNDTRYNLFLKIWKFLAENMKTFNFFPLFLFLENSSRCVECSWEFLSKISPRI